MKDIDCYIKHINEKGLKEANVQVRDLSFLKQCPSLVRLDIEPLIGYKGEFDYSPLYELPYIEELQCIAYYGDMEEYISEVDYSRIKGLVSLGIQVTRGMKNFEKIPTLKSLFVSDFKGKNRDLTDLFCSEQLECLTMLNCGVKTLRGIAQSKMIQKVSLWNCRSLDDISELSEIKETLTTLSIDCCGKIKDFSVLKELTNLEQLSLDGN